MKNSDFDLDFADGYAGEQLVRQLLTGGLTVEVKTDRRWHETGNVYIETDCWYNNSQSWEKSGLSVSKAAYWAFVLEGMSVMVPTYDLRQIVLQHGREISCVIPPNHSKGYLIRIEHILSYMAQKTKKDPHLGRDT